MWLLVFCIDLFPGIPGRLDPTVRLKGWRELGIGIGRINEPRLFIFSNTYQITSELAYYTPGQPDTYCINLGRRMNQYDLWQDFNKLIGYNAIYVKHRDQELDKQVGEAFSSWEKLPLLEVRRGNRLMHQYSIFLCKGFKGFKKAENEISY